MEWLPCTDHLLLINFYKSTGINEHVQPHRNVCVFSASTSFLANVFIIICDPKLIFCVFLRNTSVPSLLVCGGRPVAVLFKDLDFGHSCSVCPFSLSVFSSLSPILAPDHFS